MKDGEHGADGKHEALMGADSARKEQHTKRRSMCPWQRQRRKPRKPPSNPLGWSEGKSTPYDIAQRPNRVVVINGEQVRSDWWLGCCRHTADVYKLRSYSRLR